MSLTDSHIFSSRMNELEVEFYGVKFAPPYYRIQRVETVNLIAATVLYNPWLLSHREHVRS